MNKFLSTICAGALVGAMTITSFVPAVAMSNVAPPAASKASDVTLAQFISDEEFRRLRRGERRQERRVERRIERRQDQRERRFERRQDRREARRFERRGDGYYYGGYRGYRERRPGYRYYNGYYFPAAAFIAGALVTGAIVNSQPRPVIVDRNGSAHVDWCFNRYRSYRASDNTYQPTNGPRRSCVSPY